MAGEEPGNMASDAPHKAHSRGAAHKLYKYNSILWRCLSQIPKLS